MTETPSKPEPPLKPEPPTKPGPPAGGASPPLSPADEAMISAVREMIAGGRVKEAMAAVESMSSRPQLKWIGRRLIAASQRATHLGFVPEDQAQGAISAMLADMHRQDRALPSTAGGPQVVARPGAETVAIVFAGGEEAPFAHVVLQSYLRRRNCHAVYVSDPSTLFGLAGLPGLGQDVTATARSLRAIADRLGARQRFCFGFSGNGYAALRHGLALEADGVLAFSPPTNMIVPPEILAETPMIQRLHDQRPDLVEDLRPLFLAARRIPHTTIVYGADNAGDTAAAQNLGDLPNCRLVPIPGYGEHDTLSMAIVSRRLSPLLDQLMNGRAIDNPAAK